MSLIVYTSISRKMVKFVPGWREKAFVNESLWVIHGLLWGGSGEERGTKETHDLEASSAMEKHDAPCGG